MVSFINVVYDVKIYRLIMSHNGMASVQNQNWVIPYSATADCAGGDDVRKDIQKIKVPNWKTLAQDRRRWKELVEKAKTLYRSCTAI